MDEDLGQSSKFDLNQSSKFDLDYDAEEDFGESYNSPRHMEPLIEGSIVSAASSASADATDEKQNHEMNGVGDNAAETTRDGTHSALALGGMNRKLAKIKLWDPGDSSVEPSVVTVAVDVPSSGEMGEKSSDTSLGVGQQIELFQQSEKSADGGETVNITWQPRPRPIEEAWQPPFAVSKEEEQKRQAEIAALAERSRPQSAVVEHQSPALPDQSSVPKMEAGSSNSDKENGEKRDEKQPVKGLEPFTIPSILTSTVVKRTPTEKVGLAFRKAHGTVVIEKIVPGSAFDGTALRPGYECLSINGHRLRSARRAAEIVRESGSTLTLMASNAPRPPGTMYTMITLDNHSASMSSGGDHAIGMHFKMKHGLVQLVNVDDGSPIGPTSMKVGDFVLGINGSVVGSISKAVEVLRDANDDMVPILYFNMRQLRVSLVDKVIGDLWKKEWSDAYDECVVLQPGNGSSNPLTLRFREDDGMCELLDPLRAFRSENALSVVPPDHPLNSVVETLNHGIVCVLSAICEGVKLATGGSLQNADKKSDGDLMAELEKLSNLYKEGLLSKDDFEAVKTRLLKSSGQ